MQNTEALRRHVCFTTRARYLTVMALTAVALAAGTAGPASAGAPTATTVAASALAAPTATTKTTVTYTTTANLNLRSGASTNHRAVALLKTGTKLTLRGTSGTWYKVTASGRTGWVSKAYVKKTTIKTSAPAPSSAAATAKNVKFATTTALLLRKSAPSGAIIATMKKGSTVTTTGAARKVSGKTWFQVKYGTRTGWSASAHLKKVTATGQATAPVTAATTAKNVKLATTTTLLLRESAPSGAIVASMKKGSTVTTTGAARKVSGKTWFQVKYGTRTGWSSSTYLKKVATTPTVGSAAPGKFTADANVNLRASAPSGTVLVLVPKGSAVSTTGKTVNIGTTTWRQSKFGATTGWISGAYLGPYVAPPATVAPAPTAPTPGELATVPARFAISGSGWGHGVGMSQYGAQGMAKSGSGAPAILAHYYAPAQASTTASYASSEIKVQLLATASSTITPSGGRLRILDGAKVLATSPTPVSLKVLNGKVVATIGATAYTARGAMSVQWEGTRYWNSGAATTVSVPNASGGTAVGTYRHGKIDVSVLGGRLNLVNQIRMNDEYLYGLSEMPSSWEPAALQAQAIAGRTYAMRNMGSIKSACGCNVYDEVASQKFTGWAKENEGAGVSGRKWKAAVDATQVKVSGVPVSATVVRYNGALIDAVYFSSSGGRTRTAQSVWGGHHDYLQSREDPYSVSLASGNPNRSWAYTATQAKMASAFGVKDVVAVSVSRNADLTIASATATTTAGTKATIGGSAFRAALPTKSAWVGGVTAG